MKSDRKWLLLLVRWLCELVAAWTSLWHFLAWDYLRKNAYLNWRRQYLRVWHWSVAVHERPNGTKNRSYVDLAIDLKILLYIRTIPGRTHECSLNSMMQHRMANRVKHATHDLRILRRCALDNFRTKYKSESPVPVRFERRWCDWLRRIEEKYQKLAVVWRIWRPGVEHIFFSGIFCLIVNCITTNCTVFTRKCVCHWRCECSLLGGGRVKESKLLSVNGKAAFTHRFAHLLFPL